MADPYWQYRPMLDLIGFAEGTDRGRGYNETLAYGAYTGGPVDLVKMTLKQIDELQTAMLRHPNNRWNSSAVGRYQIVRTTLRAIRERLKLGDNERYDELMQDRMACYLLGSRGIDRWLNGSLSTSAMVTELAKEWASFPVWNANVNATKSYYGGQGGKLKVGEVLKALEAVKERHGRRPAAPPVSRPTPVPPEASGSWWPFIIGVIGIGLAGAAAYLGWF